MADGREGAKGSGSKLHYDPRSDASWQARLEEARAKRERVLREKGAPSQPKKRLKPWEEEGAVVFDDDVNFSPAETGVEFSARVDAMRAARPAAGAGGRASGRPGPADEVDEPPEASPPPAAAPRPSLTVVPKPPVNRVLSDPYGSSASSDPFEVGDREVIPIEELYAGPPEPVRPSRVVRVEPDIDLAALKPVTKLQKFTKRTRSSPWSVAAIFAAAIAVGPIYQMLRPIERGPLVYTLSAFPSEPALGLTAPMFNHPEPPRRAEWALASRRAAPSLPAVAVPDAPLPPPGEAEF